MKTADWERLKRAAVTEADRKFGDFHGRRSDWSPPERTTHTRLMARVQRVLAAPPLEVA